MRLGARRIITPDGERSGVVVLRDGIIAELAPDGPADVTVPEDCVLLPGLVDTHVHVNEPGRASWEGFATATAAAAAGGITTIADMPLNSIPATVDVASLAAKRAAARGQLAVDVAFWGGAVPGNAGELRALHEAGVAGFKCFLLDSGVPDFPPLDEAGLTAAMTEIAAFGGLLIAHAEDPGLIAAAPAAHGRGYSGFLASRPAAAEQRAIDGLLAAARRTGCRTHIVHLSAAAALPAIGAARAAGLAVTVETCPHYLALTAGQVPDGATAFKCCPPIRDAANQDLLWRGLAAGLIDCVVSDHSPCPPQDKAPDTGDFGAAWGGIASLQLSLPVTWTAAAARGHGLADVARWMAQAPARLAGLPGRGEIRPGARADFCVFAPDEEFTAAPALLRQRHKLTPYAGQRLRGVVRETWLHGTPVRPGATAGASGEGRDPVAQPAAADFTALPDVARRDLGGSVRYASDELFADAHALISPGPAAHDPGLFGPRGKVYDGWETRRRRAPGTDFAIIRLAAPAIVRGVVVDTAHFRGNYPPFASVEGTTLPGYPDVADLLAAGWSRLAGRFAVRGNTANAAAADGPEQLVTHVRLTIDPDGGVARLRVHGEVLPDPRLLGGRPDLAATLAGGRIAGCSNLFYAAPGNVLAPGRAAVMSDGWETARRRDAGNDWLVVALAAPGLLHDAIIDTSRFVGNAPGWAALTDDETSAVLLPRTRLLPDTEHRFRLRSPSPVSRVRLDIYPDGGIARLRLHGEVAPAARDSVARRWLAALPPEAAAIVDPADFFA